MREISLRRQAIQAVAKRIEAEPRDYTPVVMDGEKPSKIGRNLEFVVGNQHVSNLFIFGANNDGRYAEPSLAGRVKGMHNLTHDRICKDFKKYASREQVRHPDEQPPLVS